MDPENEDNYTAFNKDNIYLNKFLKENAGFLNKNANNNNNSNKLGRNNSNLKIKEEIVPKNSEVLELIIREIIDIIIIILELLVLIEIIIIYIILIIILED